MSDTTPELVLLPGRVYRAKKPKVCGCLNPVYNDRQIIYLGLYNVQYDSPSVKDGRRYPTVSREKFLAWASHEVTSEIPKGNWAEVKPKQKP